jgi:hypothetical protein
VNGSIPKKNPALSRGGNSHDRSQGGSLSSPVSSEKNGDPACMNFKRYALQDVVFPDMSVYSIHLK